MALKEHTTVRTTLTGVWKFPNRHVLFQRVPLHACFWTEDFDQPGGVCGCLRSSSSDQIAHLPRNDYVFLRAVSSASPSFLTPWRPTIRPQSIIRAVLAAVICVFVRLPFDSATAIPGEVSAA